MSDHMKNSVLDVERIKLLHEEAVTLANKLQNFYWEQSEAVSDHAYTFVDDQMDDAERLGHLANAFKTQSKLVGDFVRVFCVKD